MGNGKTKGVVLRGRIGIKPQCFLKGGVSPDWQKFPVAILQLFSF